MKSELGRTEAVTVVASAFSAIEKDDWATLAELTSDETVDRFRAREIAHLLAWAEYVATRDKTGASGFGSNAVIKAETLSLYGQVKLERIDGAPTIADLAAAKPKEFFKLASHRAYVQPTLPSNAARDTATDHWSDS